MNRAFVDVIEWNLYILKTKQNTGNNNDLVGENVTPLNTKQ